MIEVVITYFSGTLGLVELAGTVASAICVYLAIKQNIWTWFWGAIGVLFFGYLFFQFNLYSDAGLQILFFLPCQAFGWYWWMKCGPKANDDLPEPEIPVKTTNLPRGISTLIFFKLCTLAPLTVIFLNIIYFSVLFLRS